MGANRAHSVAANTAVCSTTILTRSTATTAGSRNRSLNGVCIKLQAFYADLFEEKGGPNVIPHGSVGVDDKQSRSGHAGRHAYAVDEIATSSSDRSLSCGVSLKVARDARVLDMERISLELRVPAPMAF